MLNFNENFRLLVEFQVYSSILNSLYEILCKCFSCWDPDKSYVSDNSVVMVLFS